MNVYNCVNIKQTDAGEDEEFIFLSFANVNGNAVCSF